MSRYPALFTPMRLGAWPLTHRLVMAPLTRMRATGDGVPTPMMVEYYRQRASAGLIISEATIVDPMGRGFANTPGIHNDAQVDAWRKVTDAVHDEGARIVCQLWHVGRQSHPDLLGGRAPLAPSAVASPGSSPTAEGDRPHAMPEAMSPTDIRRVQRQFASAAERAKDAGFDGVEVHGAHGYLIDQFLRRSSNHRRDGYGGPERNRIRFLCDVIDGVLDVWPGHHAGVRLSPATTFGGMSDPDPVSLFGCAIEAMNRRELAYIHLSRPAPEARPGLEAYVPMVERPLIVTGRFDPPQADREIAAGLYQLAGVGRLFIANPDLPSRLREGLSLNEPDADRFYGGGARGYIDYPRLGDRPDRSA